MPARQGSAPSADPDVPESSCPIAPTSILARVFKNDDSCSLKNDASKLKAM